MVSVFQKNASSNEQCEGFLTITGEVGAGYITEASVMDDVQEKRLLRKIDRLKKRANHYKNKCDNYETILNLHPRIQKSFNELQEERRRVSLFRSLEKRVLEQEKLIALLEKKCIQ